MNTQKQIKDSIKKGLKDILQPSSTARLNLNRPKSSVFASKNIESDLIITKCFAKSVKCFVENSLASEIEDHIEEICSTSKGTWKIDAHNLSNTLLDQSKLSCVQDNLTNVLDTCLNEITNSNVKYSNDPELDVSPLLQPGHIIEIAECMSPEKPIDVRVNALQVLLKSHFSEAVHGEGWSFLQKKLVENLCETNTEIFSLCLKAHSKLVSCSSPEALKECTLNLLESLGQHYYQNQNESKFLILQNINFYCMVHITRLLLDSLKEAVSNVARFGESRLEEMIENLVQLLAIRVPSKQSRSKIYLHPLDVISYLDPNGHWLVHLTHFNLTRRLFFSCVNKNKDFLRTTIEEIINWLSEPMVNSKNILKVVKGELNFAAHKLSIFCHSFSVFVTLTSFSASRYLFPIDINKKEEPLSVDDIVKMTVIMVNDGRFNEALTNGSDTFSTFFAHKVAKLICLKEINGSSFLITLLKSHENHEALANPIKIKILDVISHYKYLNNPFLINEMTQRRKIPMFIHCFKASPNLNPLSSKKRELERQSSLRLSNISNTDNCDVVPFEIFLKQLKMLKITDLRDKPCLVQIITRILRNFDRHLGISYATRVHTIQYLVDIYIKLQQNLESKIETKDVALSNCIAEFLMEISISPLGFHLLRELNIVATLFFDRLQHPAMKWTDPSWLLFASKAVVIDKACNTLLKKNNHVFRKDLNMLWSVIEEDCSGSELPIECASNLVLKIVSTFSLNIKAVRALTSESRDGSEITLTDDSDIRPSNLKVLIEHFALNTVNLPDFVFHSFALKVLEVLISNTDSSLYLQNKWNYQQALLQLQAYNRVDENSEVIIDECSVLRHKIVEQTFLPGRHRIDTKPSHNAPRPESTLARPKPRSRGTGELTRWLTETKLGLHDHNWLKHARKLYKNSNPDDVKASTVQDLLEHVLKVQPEIKPTITWLNAEERDVVLEPEEQLAVQLVMRFGSHHRLIQSTQQNLENLTQLVLLAKVSFPQSSDDFEGFDWFVATTYLMCSGNVEKSQAFLSLMSSLPTVLMLWPRLADPAHLAQIGSVLDTLVAEEMPAMFQLLQSSGLSWWHLCQMWISQCWWNALDWSQICHWFALAILHQLDHLLFFCLAILQANQERILLLAQQGTLYELLTNPVEKFHIADARILIDKLHKKYHSTLHSQLAALGMGNSL